MQILSGSQFRCSEEFKRLIVLKKCQDRRNVRPIYYQQHITAARPQKTSHPQPPAGYQWWCCHRAWKCGTARQGISWWTGHHHAWHGSPNLLQNWFRSLQPKKVPVSTRVPTCSNIANCAPVPYLKYLRNASTSPEEVWWNPLWCAPVLHSPPEATFFFVAELPGKNQGFVKMIWICVGLCGNILPEKCWFRVLRIHS